LYLTYKVKLVEIEDNNKTFLKKLIEISLSKQKPTPKALNLKNIYRIEVQDSIRIENEHLLQRIKKQ
jgi:hypothetical protein